MVLTVRQFENKLLLFCYHSFTIFIMQQRNFCYSATLLPQWQDVSHLRNILLLCYSATPVQDVSHLRNILLLCYSASPVAECFSSEKYSAILLPQWQNVSHLRNILLLCYSAIPVAECFSSEKYSAILLLCYPSGRMFLI